MHTEHVVDWHRVRDSWCKNNTVYQCGMQTAYNESVSAQRNFDTLCVHRALKVPSWTGYIYVLCKGAVSPGISVTNLAALFSGQNNKYDLQC